MEHAGPYLLIGRLATGGMAEVFLARREGPAGFEKLAVVKRILPQFAEDPEFRRMFLDEARLAARINHPNVVQIFELSESKDVLYLAMEYVAGFDLARVMDASLKQRRLVPPPVAARIVADAAAGLDAAHKHIDSKGKQQMVVHRDISPENLLVSEVGQVKVVDFGIARAGEGSAHTQSSSGRLKGKVHYHAPEHIQDKPLDGRADVYALGVVLYELLCARRPFEGLSELDVMRACVERDPPLPSKYYATAEPELSQLAMWALVRDPAQRPTAGEFREALEKWLRKQPCSPSDVERYLLEVIPLDAPDRTKVRTLLANAPATSTSSSDSVKRLAPLATEKVTLTQRPAFRFVVGAAALLAALGAGMLLRSPTAAPPVRTAVPPPPLPSLEDTVVEVPLSLSDAGFGGAAMANDRGAPHAGDGTNGSDHGGGRHHRPGTSLSVVTLPASDVWIDGALVGGTPLMEHELRPGKHHLRFVNAQVGLDVKRVISVASGEQSRQRFEFNKIPIVISAYPFARVLIDGTDVGTSPPQRTVSLLEGEHKVQLQCRKKTRTETLTVPLRKAGVVALQCDKK